MAYQDVSKRPGRLTKGFTLIELMVGIAIVAILVTVGLPAMNDFTVKMRVDGEISQLNRLLLTARNTAINNEVSVTVCPLAANNTCTNDWTGKISVFTNTATNNAYDSATERLVLIKEALQNSDKLEFAGDRFVYGPTGELTSAAVGLMAYCPDGYADLSRGLEISVSGRVAVSSDLDNDGKDETRAGVDVSC